MKHERRSSGNMLVLVVLTIGAVVVSALYFLMFDRLLNQRARAQTQVDALALSLASGMNVGNRIGQINNLVESSRELVFNSRENLEQCASQESAFLLPLCNQLLVEAHSGHSLVEAERENQVRVITDETSKAIANYNAQADAALPFAFCFLQTRPARIDRAALGQIRDMSSNVRACVTFPHLVAVDLGNRYVERYSNLYKAGMRASLPQDNDLNFVFAALPACVDGYSTPPRNANNDVFEEQTVITIGQQSNSASILAQIPSAIQLSCSMQAAFSANTKSEFSLSSTAVCAGDVTGRQ